MVNARFHGMWRFNLLRFPKEELFSDVDVLQKLQGTRKIYCLVVDHYMLSRTKCDRQQIRSNSTHS